MEEGDARCEPGNPRRDETRENRWMRSGGGMEMHRCMEDGCGDARKAGRCECGMEMLPANGARERRSFQ